MPNTRFIDAAWPPRIKGYPTSSTVVWNTSLVRSFSGDEHANQNWVDPEIKVDLPEAIRDQADLEALKEFNYRTRGPFRTFPFRDPVDFASIALDKPNRAPVITMTDVQIGIGDGVTTAFPLIKKYAAGTPEEYQRRIYLPVAGSVLASIDGVAPPDVTGPNGGPYTFTTSRPGGMVTFDHAPQNGDIICAGFLFDIPVRFEGDDSLAAVVRTYLAGGFGSFGLKSVKPCGWD